MTEAPVRVFISYARESVEHARRVLELAQKLRGDGVDCSVDQFVLGGPPEGWPRWMQRQIEDAVCVLIVCTDTYKRRFEGREVPGQGEGADWEGILVLQHLYETRSFNKRFIPILFEGSTVDDIPFALKPYTHFVWPLNYTDIYRVLTGQSGALASPLGAKRLMPPDP